MGTPNASRRAAAISVFLLRRGETGIAIAYAGLSVVCGLAAVWLAFKLAGFGLHR
jgi:fluoride ion exporter CrcB/FEX